MMNAQEIFNTVWFALRKQKIASARPGAYGPVCLYRGPNGTKCAVGHLIPDEYYSPELERISAEKVATILRFKLPHLHENSALLTDLQVIHDDCMPASKDQSMAAWGARMKKIAIMHNLIVPDDPEDKNNPEDPEDKINIADVKLEE